MFASVPKPDDLDSERRGPVQGVGFGEGLGFRVYGGFRV